MEEKETQKVAKPSQPKVQKTMTAEEAAIAAVVQSEEQSWLGLTDADIEDFSLSADPYPLPKEANKLLGEFAFRWCERKDSRINELRNAPIPFKWWIVNATTRSELSRHCDSLTGGIHCRDQILLMKPRWMFEKVQSLKDEVSKAKLAASDLSKKRSGRYEDLDFVTGESAKMTDADHVDWEDKDTYTGEDVSDLIDSGAAEA